MAVLPCPSFLSSPIFSSDGPKLRCIGGRQVKLNQEPISLQCYRKIVGSVPVPENQNDTSVSGEQKEAGSFSNSQRRQVLLGGLVTALTLPSLSNPVHAVTSGSPASTTATAVSTAVEEDGINAYSYVYPIGMAKRPLRWVQSRKPERYSSAAPLSPNARQRIVSERLDIKNNLVISVSVGPPNSAFLKSTETDSWNAKDVARSVLADKSTARMTTGQRVAEVSILDTKSEEKDGVRYWYYEYIVQKSPTIQERSLDVYRHSVAVTAEREGYLYSLNASTSGSRWGVFSPMFKDSISSFRLKPLTDEYVPPYKDPWRFW